MPDLALENVKPAAAKKIKPFLEDILSRFQDNIHSIHITGTALTDDFDEKLSNIKSVIVLNKMDLKLLELLAPLGKKYGKQRIAAPLIMTPDYIKTSLDVFPIEFLNFRLIHSTVLGEDIFKDIEIDMMDLRHQCEREIKGKLIWLRQGYISSQGDKKVLTEGFVNSIAGYIPLFRGISVLFDKEPAERQSEVITGLASATDINTDVFTKVLNVKHGKSKLSLEELNTIFEDYYTATEKLGKIVDEIKD
jgi:hypothetical protein